MFREADFTEVQDQNDRQGSIRKHASGARGEKQPSVGAKASEHLQLVAPAGELYAFPGVVGDAARGFDDHGFALELMETEDVLIVPGTSFNVPYRNHFRVTLLPQPEMVREVFARIDRVLGKRAIANGKVVPMKKKARPAA